MSQKFLADEFEWIENISDFTENFMENMVTVSGIGYFPETDIKYDEQLGLSENDFVFHSKKMKIGNFEKIFCNFSDKMSCVLLIRN